MGIDVGDIMTYMKGQPFKTLEVIELEWTYTPNPNTKLWVKCKDTGRIFHMRYSVFKRQVDNGIILIEKNFSFLVRRKPIRKWTI